MKAFVQRMSSPREKSRTAPAPAAETVAVDAVSPSSPPAHVAAAAVPTAVATPMATLLSSHLLRDGELILMVLKPSLWFLIFSSATFSAFVLAGALLAAMLDHRMHDKIYLQLAAMLVTVRLVLAILQWVGRLYVLTDMRVIRISGFINVTVFDCPLRKIARTRLISTMREKCVMVGSIEIIPLDSQMPAGIWQTISRPASVYETLVAAINNSRQPGCGGE